MLSIEPFLASQPSSTQRRWLYTLIRNEHRSTRYEISSCDLVGLEEETYRYAFDSTVPKAKNTAFLAGIGKSRAASLQIRLIADTNI